MATKPARNGSYVAQCSDCPFEAHGSEAFCRRKGSFHAKKSGHRLVVGLGVVDDE